MGVIGSGEGIGIKLQALLVVREYPDEHCKQWVKLTISQFGM